MKVLLRMISDVKKYYKYAIYAAKSELKSEVASSFLNWIWWILDPLLFMMVYSFVSIIVFGQSEKYFAAFVFLGLTTWNFFNKSILDSVKLVKNNRAIVSKVYLPKYILILVRLFVNGFKMMISFGLVVGMMFLYRVPLDFKMLYFFPILLTLICITFSISTIVLHLGVFVEDLHNMLSVFFKLVFYLSGIFFAIEKRVPEPFNELLLRFNPAAFLIDEFRRVLLYNQMPYRKVLLSWLLLSFLISCIGIKLIYQNENSYVKVI